MPYRGRPNASYLVPLTMRSMAETRGDDLEELCRRSTPTPTARSVGPGADRSAGSARHGQRHDVTSDTAVRRNPQVTRLKQAAIRTDARLRFSWSPVSCQCLVGRERDLYRTTDRCHQLDAGSTPGECWAGRHRRPWPGDISTSGEPVRIALARMSKKRSVLTALVALVVLAVAGTTVGYAAVSKTVTLSVDGKTREVHTLGGTVARPARQPAHRHRQPRRGRPVAGLRRSATARGSRCATAGRSTVNVDGEQDHLLDHRHHRPRRARPARPAVLRRRLLGQPLGATSTARAWPCGSSRRRRSR